VKWLATRVAAFPPWLQDLVLALALAAVNIGSVIRFRGQLHPLGVAYLLLGLQVLPLVWRRRYPVAVFLAVGLPRTLYDQLGFGYAPLALGPAIAYYTVMDRSSTRMRWIISLLLLAGILRSQALPDHTEPYAFFIQALLFGSAGMVGLFSRARRAYLSEAQDRAARAESERDQQAAMAAARERARIARELHDVVAHHVSLMAVQAEAAGSLLPGQPAAASRSVEIIGETARQALVELRRLLGVLRGPGEHPLASPVPSLADLDAVLAQVRGAGLAVDVTVDGGPGALAPGIDLTAFRIVQEALTNTLRHSGATQAFLTISYEPGYVTVSVSDAGPAAPGPPADPSSPVGHGAPAAPAGGVLVRPSPAPARDLDGSLVRGGFGLAGITERVASCGGSLTVGPTGLGGFAVTARLPAL
jgi:signal transduction histidine kinase